MNTNPIKEILTAVKEVLSSYRYFTLFLLLSFIVAFIFVFLPVKTIPGNTFGYQLSIFRARDYLFLTILAGLSGLLLTMNVYIFRQKLKASLGTSGVGTGTSVIASIFATATCASCIASIFGFLGLSTVFFLIEVRSYIVGAAIVIVMISLYLASRSVNKVCESCKISVKGRKNKLNFGKKI